MYFYTKFYTNTLKYDWVNVFSLKSNLNFPKLKVIILNLQLKTCDIKRVSASLLAFELITQQWGQLLGAWKSKISLKMRKGSAIGCKLSIKKYNLFAFFNKTVLEIVPKLKNKKIQNYNAFQFKVQNIFNINELKNHYSFFHNLGSLKIVILINGNDNNLIFFSSYLQII